jgi:hypothetical protein
MGPFWPSDNPRFIIAKKKKAMPVPPKRTITAFVGSYITLRDYQTPQSLYSPTPYSSKAMKAVKGRRWLGVIQLSLPN